MNILFGWNSLSRLWISYKSVLCLKFQVLSAPPPGSPSIKPPTSSTGMFLRSNLGNWENLGLQNHQFFPKIVVNFPKVCPQQFSQFLPAASVVKCLHPPFWPYLLTHAAFHTQTVNCRAFGTSPSDEDMRQAGAPLPSCELGKWKKSQLLRKSCCFFRWFPRDRWRKLENTRKV